MSNHRRLRESISLLSLDQFAGKAQGRLDEYVRVAVQDITLPQLTTNNTRESKWGRLAGSVANEIDFKFVDQEIRTRTVGGVPHNEGVKGGFSLMEIQRLLYAIEKRSASVRVKSLNLKPYDPASGSRDRASRGHEAQRELALGRGTNSPS